MSFTLTTVFQCPDIFTQRNIAVAIVYSIREIYVEAEILLQTKGVSDTHETSFQKVVVLILSGVTNDGFLLNILKTLFRLSGVLVAL